MSPHASPDFYSSFFPDLSEHQLSQLTSLSALYAHWNKKVNVISRKDIENLEERHVLHSLSIAKFITFSENEHILDIGTGGGFPGIPLAIVFPHTQFTLCDSIGKKIMVVQEISKALDLKNVKAVHGRADQMRGPFQGVITRAVSRLSALIEWTNNNLVDGHHLIALKGGDLNDEIQEMRDTYPQLDLKVDLQSISAYFPGEFFREKLIVDVKHSVR